MTRKRVWICGLRTNQSHLEPLGCVPPHPLRGASLLPSSAGGSHFFAGGTDVPRRGPSPLLGHVWRRSEGARLGDGRDKPGLKPHSALFRLLLFAGGTEVPRRGPSPLLGHAWRRLEPARLVTAGVNPAYSST